MKLILKILIAGGAILAQFSWADCPLEPGESFDCEDEQRIVQTALSTVIRGGQTTYCRGLGEGKVQCRIIVSYKDKRSKQKSDQIFEEWFYTTLDGNGDPINEPRAFRGFFIRKANGKYNVYWDDFPTEILRIDDVVPGHQDVEVHFSPQEDLPNFDIKVISVDTGEIDLRNITYTSSTAIVTRLNDPRPADVYLKVDPGTFNGNLSELGNYLTNSLR